MVARPRRRSRSAASALALLATVVALSFGTFVGLTLGPPAPATALAQPGERSSARVAERFERAQAATTVPPTAAPDRQRLDDPAARRTIDGLVIGLLALGALVAGLTVWYWRSTQPMPPALEPLVLMSGRRFRARPRPAQDEALDEVRERKALTDPPPRAADFLRHARGEDG